MMTTPSTYAVLDANGIVLNIVIWDGQSPMEWPQGATAQSIPAGATGYVIGEAAPK